MLPSDAVFFGKMYPFLDQPSHQFLNYHCLDLASVPAIMQTTRPILAADLSMNNLTTLPSSLPALAAITRLDLGDNPFSHLPAVLRTFVALEELYLAGCPIPTLPDWLPDLHRLRILDLADTAIPAVPDGLRSLPSLQVLSLSGLPLTALPPWLDACALRMLILHGLPLCDLTSLRTCTTLEHLDLSAMGLTHVPDWIRTLPRLQYLNLSGNPITDLPAWLGELPLTTLDLDGTQLQHCPDWEAWTTLRHLNLGGKHHDPTLFAGAFPASLISLELCNTALTAIPPMVRHLSALETFRFENGDTLSVPAWLLEDLPLKTLKLQNMRITDMPPLSQSIALEQLSITNGFLPSWPMLGDNTPHLRTIDFSETRIVDETLHAPCVLPGLAKLSLSSPSDHLVAHLQMPMLQTCSISGAHEVDLNAMLQPLTQLTQLALGNCFDTTLPNQIRSCTRLRMLDLRFNWLVALPDWISELEHLEWLNVEYNELSVLTEALRDLPQLHTIDITANPLRVFPAWLHRMPQLHAIDFQFPPDDLALHDQQHALLAAGVRCNISSPRPRDE